ncbi:hypothetical protein [Micromonospora ureilytica]|uniref:S26 family signal peptidase n=1 Tax=Micromonospora ureilytica TaxID=709868 RepID=A0ABS0JHJ6_9ACTN|nr:hypothetical protein [Micromonospora ureilytica]MBG6066225.1 hypothetical protein [Micromonospora ureilytica]
MKAGDLLIVGREASVQFIRPIRFRVIRVLDWITYDEWIWLDGYQLDDRGDAVARRSIFVMKAGLRIQRRTAPAGVQPRRSSSRMRA